LILVLYHPLNVVVVILEIRPFYLHMMPEEDAHLCPVMAVANWINASGITQGYLFCRMASGDRVERVILGEA
jgi:hypothetical protein